MEQCNKQSTHVVSKKQKYSKWSFGVCYNEFSMTDDLLSLQHLFLIQAAGRRRGRKTQRTDGQPTLREEADFQNTSKNSKGEEGGK